MTETRVEYTPSPIARRERLLGYICKWQGRLRLLDWDITLAEEEPDRDTNGDVHMMPNRLQASIAIDGRIVPEMEEVVVLHECLEVLLDEWDTYVRELIDRGIPESVREDYGKRREAINHRVIYRLESALLPDGPKRPWHMVKTR